jgi:type VI protein secretion system component VasK
VWDKARGEFWGLVKAGWRFWPLVSLVNYVFLTSVEARSLVGALAGLGWGIYLSLMTGQ